MLFILCFYYRPLLRYVKYFFTAGFVFLSADKKQHSYNPVFSMTEASALYEIENSHGAYYDISCHAQ